MLIGGSTVCEPLCRTEHFLKPLLLCCICSDTTLKLNRKIDDLEDVRYLVNVLNEVGKLSEVDSLRQSFPTITHRKDFV